jgi:hypothetical protein
MKLAITSLLLTSAAAFAPAPAAQKQVGLKGAIDDLQEIAVKSNPVLKFYDPLQLSTTTIWGETNSATIQFLRHAEIKHGRVAMAAFVGTCPCRYYNNNIMINIIFVIGQYIYIYTHGVVVMLDFKHHPLDSTFVLFLSLCNVYLL